MIEGLVYVIGPEASTAPVKIGFTSNTVEERLSALSIGSPVLLIVVAAIKASNVVERHIHKMCRIHRLHGEWFERKGAVIDVINMMMTDPEALTIIEQTVIEKTIPHHHERHQRQLMPLPHTEPPPSPLKRGRGRPRRIEGYPGQSCGLSRAQWYRRDRAERRIISSHCS